MNDDEYPDERLDLLARALPPRFDVRVVLLPPGCELGDDAGGWDDALVEVESGAVELTVPSGRRLWLRAGDLCWAGHGRLRATSSPHGEPAVLVAVSRSPHCRPLDRASDRDGKSAGCRLITHDDDHARRNG
jgi:hypothetical protein